MDDENISLRRVTTVCEWDTVLQESTIVHIHNGLFKEAIFLKQRLKLISCSGLNEGTMTIELENARK
jgi:hypothetical protein